LNQRLFGSSSSVSLPSAFLSSRLKRPPVRAAADEVLRLAHALQRLFAGQRAVFVGIEHFQILRAVHLVAADDAVVVFVEGFEARVEFRELRLSAQADGGNGQRNAAEEDEAKLFHGREWNVNSMGDGKFPAV
jgi:hypothetical protein